MWPSKCTVADSRLWYIGPTDRCLWHVTQITDCCLCVYFSFFFHSMDLWRTQMCKCVYTHANTSICIATQQAYCLFHHSLAMLFTYLIVAVLSSSEMTNRSISFHWNEITMQRPHWDQFSRCEIYCVIVSAKGEQCEERFLLDRFKC